MKISTIEASIIMTEENGIFGAQSHPKATKVSQESTCRSIWIDQPSQTGIQTQAINRIKPRFTSQSQIGVRHYSALDTIRLSGNKCSFPKERASGKCPEKEHSGSNISNIIKYPFLSLGEGISKPCFNINFRDTIGGADDPKKI